MRRAWLTSWTRTSRCLGLALIVTLSCAAPIVQTSASPGSTPGRCAEGRPQSEISFAGILPHEPRSSLLACVLIAENTSRVYRLTDGRQLQIYQRAGGLPAKPGAATPLQTGTRMIGSQSWSWMTVNGQTVLSTTLPDQVYVELDVATGSNVNTDLDMLQAIAATLS
jgi:hypothetical protein